MLKIKNATVFGYYVNEPKSYGVLGFDEYKKLLQLRKNHMTKE